MDGRRVRACASQNRLLSRPTSIARPMPRALQKERRQSLKVCRTTAERTLALPRTHAAHNLCEAHGLTERLLPCAAQASGHTCWACVASTQYAHTAAVARVCAHGDRTEVAHVRPPPRCARGSTVRRGHGRAAYRLPRQCPRGLRRPACSVGMLCRATMTMFGLGWACVIASSVWRACRCCQLKTPTPCMN